MPYHREETPINSTFQTIREQKIHGVLKACVKTKLVELNGPDQPFFSTSPLDVEDYHWSVNFAVARIDVSHVGGPTKLGSN